MERTQALTHAEVTLRNSAVAVLSTVAQDGYPCSRVMFNLRREAQFPGLVPYFTAMKDLTVLLTTNTSSAKRLQIEQNAKVAVCYTVPEKFLGLTLIGNIEIVDDPEVKEALWQPGWECYYPSGAHDPDPTVLLLRPRRIQGWAGSKGKYDFVL